MAKPALGRGLSALMGSVGPATVPASEPGESIRQIAHAEIVASPLQPRKMFAPEELAELVESIREKGVIQPLIVRLVAGRYELIAGERRWRAAGIAGLKTLPVLVRAASDREVLELALIENLQRADLNPIEEAEAYARLMHEFSLTQEQVAQRVGRGRAAVANAVRLLALPEALRGWLSRGDLSVGHAKVLLSLPTESDQVRAAERVRRENLSVRATERLIASMLQPPADPKPSSTNQVAPASHLASADLRDVEKRLQHHFGTRVKIVGDDAAGKVEVHYYSRADLERLLDAVRLPRDG